MSTHRVEHLDSAHDHSYDDHSHDYRQASRRSLYIVMALLACHMVVEVIGGIVSGSLVLLAHATHMMTDVVAIGLALFAMWVAERPATATRTFGYHRIEVLVVMINAFALWALAGWILFEAYGRFRLHVEDHDHHVEGWIMLIIASIGLVINLVSAWILRRSSQHSINVEGAFWHIMVDLMGTIAVLAAGIGLLLFDWDFADPVLSIALAGMVIVSAGRLALKVIRILLESVPSGIDIYQLCNRIEDVPGITLIHDIHVWTITTGFNAMDAHVLVDPEHPEDIELLMRSLRGIVKDEFSIHHITLQMERSVADCSESHHFSHLEAVSLGDLD